MKRYLLAIFAAVVLLGSPVRAEDTLADWAANFAQPEVQRKILDRIFPEQLGPVSTAVLDRQNKTYFFSDNSSWVRLGKDIVWDSSVAKSPFLIVTCMLYHNIDQEPVSATSYLFRDTVHRPGLLTGGYATHERVHFVKLPKLEKSFLVVEDSAASPQGAMRQWTAFLMEVEPSGLGDHPRNVWTSPPAYHSFQLGFADLDGKAEELVLRTIPPSMKKTAVNDYGEMADTNQESGNETSQYAAYRWAGDHFEVDSFVFETRLKELPKTVWKYGAGR